MRVAKTTLEEKVEEDRMRNEGCFHESRCLSWGGRTLKLFSIEPLSCIFLFMDTN